MSALSFVHLNDVSEFKPPFDHDYALLLLIEGVPLGSELRKELCGKIVASKCQYFLCSGSECSLWDDDVDWAAIEQKKDVITTWHENETLQEVLYFLTDHVKKSMDDKTIDLKCVMSLGGDGSILGRCKEIMKEMKA
jgi:hypothetical protein